VSASGVASAEFAISPAVGLPQDFRLQRIPAAFDGSNWLVVWSDDRAVGPGVRGCLISATGSPSIDFLVASTPGTVVEDPLVAFDGSDFIVAWQSTPTGAAGGSQVYYARVASTGTVDAPMLVPSDFTPINQMLLFLAPQKPSGDTLLLYRDSGETPAQTRSVRIASDASLRDPGGTVLFKENMADGGFGQPIGATFVDTAWHILSSFDQLEDSSVYLHKLDTAGVVTPPQGIFAEVGLGPTGMALDEYAPAFAGAGEWLFVRNERVTNTVYHLLGKRVTFAGEDKDPTPFQIDTATQGILRNGVAAQVGNSFLVAWLDGRTGTTQPADAQLIAAAVVDATAAGTAGTPLVATATASPTSGEAPLSVLFDSAASTGSYDTLLWDFGDGTTATQTQVTHTYRNNGTFVAQLKLTKGAYTVFDTAVIIVGGGSSVGLTGGTQVGVPVQSTPGLEPGLCLSTIAIKLDFVDSNKDILRVTGIVDVGQLPDSLTGIAASAAAGSASFAFRLDAKGGYKSDVSVNPVVSFALNAATGAFVFQAVNADLRSALDALGAKNETVTKVIVPVPVTVMLDRFAATATQGVTYKATQDVSGTGNYAYLGAGDEISGSFLIGKFSATEVIRGKDGVKVHSFSIKGQVKRPNGGNYRPGDIGEFSFSIGNYTVGIPAGQFRAEKGITKYVGRVGVSGLKKFSLDFNSGVFNLQLLKVPAEGVGGTGMPLAKSGTDITKVDLNLSFQFDLADGTKFSAGRYIYIGRKNAATKNWTLR
ncbi:MAG: PKD domain-containing protein, partial [Planctomycetota bacterium]|nr:PKD domain-containing protein [Planctomycetota bacterium]